MKVLIVNSVCGYGSTGRICTDLYAELLKNGHECKIAYGRKEPLNVNINDTIHIGSKKDVITHVLLSRITDKHGFYSKKATETFIREIEEYDPDIIHLHNIHGYYVNIEKFFSYLKKCKKPVVWTFHDCWNFTGHCAYYVNADCYKWKSGCKDCSWKNIYPKSIWLDNSEENYNIKRKLFTEIQPTIITVSNWLANEVKSSYFKDERIKVINNGIDMELFKYSCSEFRNKNNIQNKKIVLGVANVWSEGKGINDFIYLANTLPEEYKIVLVGVSRKLKAELPKNILTLDRTDNLRELAEIYSASDVYFNASTIETFGVTTIEAIACGTPVIGYDATAISEIIDDGVGFLIEKGNVDKVRERIIEICQQNLFNRKDLRVIAEKYDKNRVYENYIKLYEEILKSGGNYVGIFR